MLVLLEPALHSSTDRSLLSKHDSLELKIDCIESKENRAVKA